MSAALRWLALDAALLGLLVVINRWHQRRSTRRCARCRCSSAEAPYDSPQPDLWPGKWCRSCNHRPHADRARCGQALPPRAPR